MRDYSFGSEPVDDGARRSAFWDVDVLSGFPVGDWFVQVGVGPGAEARDGKNSNHNYQQDEPLHVLFKESVSCLDLNRREFFFDR